MMAVSPCFTLSTMADVLRINGDMGENADAKLVRVVWALCGFLGVCAIIGIILPVVQAVNSKQ